MKNNDVIIGIHSIAEALKNPERTDFRLVGTSQGLKEFKEVGKIDQKIFSNVKVDIVNSHELQQEAMKIYLEHEFKYSRIPSQIFLQATPLPIYDSSWLLSFVEKNKNLKIFCLDQVTDVHNGAAILRTAAFYDLDILILGQKGNLGLTPSFFRIASGAAEHVKIIRCSNLSRILRMLIKKNIECIGFSEHSNTTSVGKWSELSEKRSRCLVMGAEDKGLSFAVKRVLETTVSLKSLGKIQTLNVSVAAAIGMERYF